MSMKPPRAVRRCPGYRVRSTVSRAALAVTPLLMVTLLAPGPARASIVMALDLPDLVRQADHIALVDVVSQQSAWDTKHERIISTVELAVVERWKGAAPPGAASDHLTIVQPGGTVGDLTMTVTGLSTFSPGERALVFLRGASTNAQVLGMSQGKRLVRFEATSKKWLVHAPDLRQTTLVKAPLQTPASGAAGLRPVRVTPTVRETGLDELRTQVQSLLRTTSK
jgi:hypothetical protein